MDASWKSNVKPSVDRLMESLRFDAELWEVMIVIALVAIVILIVWYKGIMK